MPTQKTYQVARHLFCIRAASDSFLWKKMEECYGPFEVSPDQNTRSWSGGHEGLPAAQKPAFEVELCDDIRDFGGCEFVYSNRDSVEPGFLEITVYKSEEGHHFEFRYPHSEEVNGRLSISKDYKRARFTLSGAQGHQWYTFNSGMNICYLLATAALDTIFIHASCVSYQGKAYLFLGKSGTGKSTHSRMWLNALEGVELMNDDHPIIRIGTDGQPVAFGSPWSGKTRCYKNVEAPIGGIIRISRAPYNKARRLSVIESYASLISSCSGITWEKDLADGKDHSIQGIIAKVPCWVMECLPDNEAAVVCSQSVTQV